MARLLWRRELEKQFDSEIAPKIKRLEVDHGDSVLANELRRIKAQINFGSAEVAEKAFGALDKKVTQALEVYENEYQRIYKPVIEGLAEEGKIDEALDFFDNEEKLSLALRLYSRDPLQKIDLLREQIKSKSQMSRNYIALIRKNATIECTALRNTLDWFLMEYEKTLDESVRIQSNLTRTGFFTLGENIIWVAHLADTQKTLEKKAQTLDGNNKKLLDLLIFVQRYLSEEHLNKLTEKVAEKEIIKPGLTSSQIREFLPNLFLSGDMTDDEKRFCQRMKNSLAKCVYEKISRIYPV